MFFKHKFSSFSGLFSALFLVALAGCASTAPKQTNDDLLSVTAAALSVPVEQLQMVTRSDEGPAVNYSVKTNDKRVFTCVRTATYTITGVVKSSPLCNQTSGKKTASTAPQNALQKAAIK